MEPDALMYICLYHWFRKLAHLSGIDLFRADFKPHPRAYILISALYVLAVCCLWTLYHYPLEEKLICVGALGFNCQGIVKFHCILNNTKRMKYLIDFLMKVYRANKYPSPNKARLEKSVNVTVFIFKAGMALLITSAILTCIVPVISYLLFGRVDAILPCYMPGINEREITGYACLAVFHVYILFIFVIGTAFTDLGLMTLVVHAYAMSHLSQNAVIEFNSMVTKNKRAADIRASLNNLILMHIEFMNFTKMTKLIYSEMCLIQITMANAVMVVLTYIILMTDWFPAYFFMATAFFQVFEYSLLGTITELANDTMYSSICNISLIYLPVSEQKKVVLMTLIAQTPHNLTIGGFRLLNVEIFVSSMKTTYSTGMLLINMQLQ